MDLSKKRQLASEIYARIQAEARRDWPIEDRIRAEKKSTKTPVEEQLFEVVAFEAQPPSRLRGLDAVASLELLGLHDEPSSAPHLTTQQVQLAFLKVDKPKLFQTTDGDIVKIRRLR